MGLFNYLRTKVLGEDLDQIQRDLDEANARQAELDRAALARGVYDQAAFEQAERQRLENFVEQRDVAGQVNAAFEEGLNEGYENVTGGIRKTLAAPFNFAFSSLPWQLWVVGLGAAFFYLGGFTWLKGLLAKR